MLNTVLKQKIDEKLQALSAGDSLKTLFVLKGIPMDLVDPDHAPDVNLTALLENRFAYFGNILNQRKFVTYEEFLLLGSFADYQYDRICILNNNLWMTEYPVDLRCSEDQLQGLIANFREDADELYPDLSR